ncbi:MAG: hydrogenase maturation nickel metallochaperone HypA [Desulfovibrio sp.]|nr:hydrogenase maturation nickel metallochaperone HypA [Desulfovibrio sp.]
MLLTLCKYGLGICGVLPYFAFMHEASLVASLLAIMREERDKYGPGARVTAVALCCGALSNALPAALAAAFEIMTRGTEFAGTELTIAEEPLRLACGACGEEFSPDAFPVSPVAPCPRCGEDFGHRVTAGRELYVRRLTVEPDP